jgi:glutathione S-transferase
MSKRSAEEEIGEAEKKQFTEEVANGNGVHVVAEEERAANVEEEKKAESKPILYHIQHFSSSRPLFVIHELGITDKIDIKVLPASELKSEEVMSLNPHGTIPIFKTASGEVILESGAIAFHLLEKYGGLDHPLWGKPEQRAKLLQWLWYAPSTLYPAFVAACVPGAVEEEKAKILEKLNEKHLAFIASELGDKPFLLGDDFTLADLFIGYDLSGLQYLKWLSKYPSLEAYVSRVNARPSYQLGFA